MEILAHLDLVFSLDLSLLLLLFWKPQHEVVQMSILHPSPCQGRPLVANSSSECVNISGVEDIWCLMFYPASICFWLYLDKHNRPEDFHKFGVFSWLALSCDACAALVTREFAVVRVISSSGDWIEWVYFILLSVCCLELIR